VPRKPTEKKATTIRLGADVKSQLARVSSLSRKSESQVVEDALKEYYKNHDWNRRYILNVTSKHIVLICLDGEYAQPVHVEDRNGESPREIQEKLAAKFNSVIELIGKEEGQ
jgi:hypothetical protein